MYSEDWSALPGHDGDDKDDSEALPLASKTCAHEPTMHPCKPRLGEWTVEDVVHWSLTTTLSPEVASWLRKHEVSGAVLRTLDEAELAAMGLEPFGRRRQLLLLREELLAEDAAKEKKANGPRTDQALVKSKTSRHALKCDKDFEPSPCLPTPLRSLLKSASAKGVQDVTSPAVKLKQPIAYELQDSPTGTELTLPSEAVAARAKAQKAVDPPEGASAWQKPVRIEGVQSSSRCDSRQGPGLPSVGPVDAQGRLGRAISWKPAVVQQSVSPSAFATASSRYVSWVPATAGIGSQEATSISVKVVRHASWTPARMPVSSGVPELGKILEAKAQAWAQAFAQASQQSYASLRAFSQSRTSSRRIVGYSVTIRPRPVCSRF